jgi:hypothetical protein
MDKETGGHTEKQKPLVLIRRAKTVQIYTNCGIAISIITMLLIQRILAS